MWTLYSETHDTSDWKANLQRILADYNSSPIASLQNRSPDQVSADSPVSQLQRETMMTEANREIASRAKGFAVGQKVRLLMPKSKVSKGTARWSDAVYVVTRRDVNRWRVRPDTDGSEEMVRKYKETDLLAVAATATQVHAPEVARAAQDRRSTARLAREGVAANAGPARITRSTPIDARAERAKRRQ
jgi:hypothetical protein